MTIDSFLRSARAGELVEQQPRAVLGLLSAGDFQAALKREGLLSKQAREAARSIFRARPPTGSNTIRYRDRKIEGE
jgi:hypothetical protein